MRKDTAKARREGRVGNKERERSEGKKMTA